MSLIYCTVFILKQIAITFSYMLNNRIIYENEDIMRVLRTKIFTLQCIDYVNLNFIKEGLSRKNIVQITHYPYLMVYSWLIDSTTLYMDYVYTSEGTSIYPAIYLHSLFMLFEVIYTFKHIKEHREEYSLKYFRKYGASLEFNRTNCMREKLMLCLRFNLFSQYIVAVHYFLGVYVEDDVIVCLMFIGQIHLGIVNMSYSMFKKIESKEIRIFQIINLVLAVFIRFLQLVIEIQSTTKLERLNFYSIVGVEIITLTMMIYISYADFLNFGVDTIS